MKTDGETDENLVEVFSTRDAMMAQAAIDEVLEPAGIDAVVHDRTSHMLPAPATMDGGYFVAVAASQQTQAMAALREAIDGGIVDGELAAAAEPAPL